ncbi:WD40 repeat-like protein [Suillus weaverae]|nr:WD40 repeat-like protein [Suillus weaverae]
MASSSTQPDATANQSILTPAVTLEGYELCNVSLLNGGRHEYKDVSSISYFPDGKQMISGSCDKTVRRWDLQEGKEIEEAREVFESHIKAVGVSRDGRWVVAASGGCLKVSEVETGIVRTFHEGITCIDISTDSRLLASGSTDFKAWIWSLDTGELADGPFKFSYDYPGTLVLRLSEDSQKLAVMLNGQCLQVWDVQAQKLDVQKSTPSILRSTAPVFWTTKDKSIVAAFTFVAHDFPRTIYEFDASTLETVGAPFKGHTNTINCLALSYDCVLLASSSDDDTIKLWAFESRQLLASFDVQFPITLVLSPDSRQLAYTTLDDSKIYVCNIPANILASIGLAEEQQPSTSKSERPRRVGLLNSNATRPVRPHVYLRSLRKLLSSSSYTDAVRIDEPRNPLDFPATSLLPRPLIKPDETSRPTPAPPTIQSSPSTTLKLSLHRLSTWWPFRTHHSSPAINVIDVPLAPGKLVRMSHFSVSVPGLMRPRIAGRCSGCSWR